MARLNLPTRLTPQGEEVKIASEICSTSDCSKNSSASIIRLLSLIANTPLTVTAFQVQSREHLQLVDTIRKILGGGLSFVYREPKRLSASLRRVCLYYAFLLFPDSVFRGHTSPTHPLVRDAQVTYKIGARNAGKSSQILY